MSDNTPPGNASPFSNGQNGLQYVPTPHEPVKYATVGWGKLTRNTSRTRFLIPGVVAQRKFLCIAGDEKTYKTSVALDMGGSLVTGTAFLNRYPTRPSTPAIPNPDDPTKGIAEGPPAKFRVAFMCGESELEGARESTGGATPRTWLDLQSQPHGARPHVCPHMGVPTSHASVRPPQREGDGGRLPLPQ